MSKNKHIFHGVFKQDNNDIVTSVRRRGYYLLKNFYTKNQINFLNNFLTQAQKYYLKHFKINDLLRINEFGILRSPFSFSKKFLKTSICNKKIFKLVEMFLGQHYVLYSQVGVIDDGKKKLYQTRWHREIQYQHFTSSQLMGLQIIIPLTKFNIKAPGTEILPYSHLFEYPPSNNIIDNDREFTNADIGDIILMNPMTYHRSGFNRGIKRRILTTTFVRPVFNIRFNHMLTIKKNNKYDFDSLNEKEKSILGKRWHELSDAKEWLRERINDL